MKLLHLFICFYYAMKKVNKNLFLLLFFSTISVFSIFCQDNQNDDLLKKMLAHYISEDYQTKTLSLRYEQSVLSEQASKNQLGFNVTLSTGNISIQPDFFSVNPSISLSLPTANNTSFKVEVPLKISEQTWQKSIDGTKVGIQTELLGSSRQETKLSLQKSKRSVLEAKRALENQILVSEINFYDELKKLYTEYASFLSSENSLYEKQIDMDLLITQGYGENSSRYRTTQLELMELQRNVNVKSRSLQRLFTDFSKKCGLENQLTSETIPDVSSILILSGILDKPQNKSMEDYKEIENSKWNLDVAQKELAMKKPVTVSLGTNYTFKNSSFNNSDTFNTSVTLDFYGAQVSAGVEFPFTGQNKTPAAQFILLWSPNNFKSININKKQSQLKVQLAQLEYQNAINDYYDDIEESNSNREELLWIREVGLQELNLYKELVDDTSQWYNQGYSTDSEYKQALSKYNNAKIQCYINDINILLAELKNRQLFY